jgi:hypothetical protein
VTPAYDLISLPPDTEPGKPNMPPGTFFQMDMGYVRGTKYRVKDTDGNIVTSLDGYNSYLLVVDYCNQIHMGISVQVQGATNRTLENFPRDSWEQVRLYQENKIR